MDVPMSWVKEYAPVTADIKDFIEDITLSGSKVEGYTTVAGEIKNVVTGYIKEIVKHPDADKLVICTIDAGQGRDLTIVTGAPNVKVGDYVPVALDNAVIAGGKEIHTGELRGVVSEGMLCSVEELGCDRHDFPEAPEYGIYIFPEPVELGKDIVEVLDLKDEVVEYEITSNRPDCFSILGIAREAAATYDIPFHYPEIKVAEKAEGKAEDFVKVTIENPTLCPRYVARVVKNVKIGPSPRWMRKRLRMAGVRPINNIVDITNYVMLEYGQPMHAFDFSCVEGGHIIVRTAHEGETIQTLDGNERKLTPNMLCICDEHKPVCVAGVMGGANSEIVGDTAMVLFESANFNGVSVRRTASALGMRTDASSRYEKGLDMMNTIKAVERACELVELLGCGEVVDGVMDVVAKEKAPTVVKLEPDKINALLGTELSEDLMREILVSLGFILNGDDIYVPSWRGDVEHYSDIAEEVARFYGYNKIPCTLMRGETTRGGFSEQQRFDRAIGGAVRALGYDEIITYSFISPTYYDKIRMPKDSSLRNSLKILNPLGEDTSIMRTTILPSMLEIIARNHSYRNKSARLYELGKIYLPREDGLADEPKYLSLGAYGDGVDFFSFKGSIETLLHELRITDVKYVACTDNDSYHPGRCAKVYAGETYLGVFGQIHPLVAANYGMDTEVYTAELSFDAMYEKRGDIPVYQPLPKFPAVTRDIAVVCDEAVTVGALEESIRRGAKGLLKDVSLFDIYRGPGVASGKKSVAFNLVLRADDRSLTGEEADEDVQSILAALKADHNAVLR